MFGGPRHGSVAAFLLEEDRRGVDFIVVIVVIVVNSRVGIN